MYIEIYSWQKGFVTKSFFATIFSSHKRRQKGNAIKFGFIILKGSVSSVSKMNLHSETGRLYPIDSRRRGLYALENLNFKEKHQLKGLIQSFEVVPIDIPHFDNAY